MCACVGGGGGCWGVRVCGGYFVFDSGSLCFRQGVYVCVWGGGSKGEGYSLVF